MMGKLMTPLHLPSLEKNYLDAHPLRHPRAAPPSLWAYHWARLKADARQARANAGAILHFSPPQIVQFVLGAWAILWGLWMMACAPATFATSPGIYGWMHAGLFASVPPRAWGIVTLWLGLWQGYALVWPHTGRTRACLRAARALARFWAGLAAGHGFNMVANRASSPAPWFYLFLAIWSLYVVWRLSGRD